MMCFMRHSSSHWRFALSMENGIGMCTVSLRVIGPVLLTADTKVDEFPKLLSPMGTRPSSGGTTK